jgi:hypothetical protein
MIVVFRRMFLLRLHQAEWLSESFKQNLLSRVHPGFAVYAGPPVNAAEIASLQSQVRYITRPVLEMDALRKLDGGSPVLETPPILGRLQPRLSWIHWNEFTASRRTFRVRDAIVKDCTGPAPIPASTDFRCDSSCFPAESSRFSLAPPDGNAYKNPRTTNQATNASLGR